MYIHVEFVNVPYVRVRCIAVALFRFPMYITMSSLSVCVYRGSYFLQVSEWLIGGCGLRYDREWVVLSEHRACLSQKQEPRLSLILPYLVPHSQELELKYPGIVRMPLWNQDTLN